MGMLLRSAPVFKEIDITYKREIKMKIFVFQRMVLFPFSKFIGDEFQLGIRIRNKILKLHNVSTEIYWGIIISMIIADSTYPRTLKE